MRGSRDDCGVPVDAPIEVRFDWYLLPKTATRQSLRVYSGTRANALLLLPTYDVVERVVSYRPGYGAALEPGVLYEVEMPLPSTDPNGFGFQAFDGAPLEKGRIPLRFSFRTATTTPKATIPPGASPTCADALGVLFDSECASCHAAGPNAPLGLVLDSTEGLRETVVGRVARETDLGGRSGRTLVDPLRFGIGMPLVDPGNPGTSYLLYKLLASPTAFGTGTDACSTTHRVVLPEGSCLAPAPSERAALESWFVAGDPMPPAPARLLNGVADLRVLQGFIARDADTTECP